MQMPMRRSVRRYLVTAVRDLTNEGWELISNASEYEEGGLCRGLVQEIEDDPRTEDHARGRRHLLSVHDAMCQGEPVFEIDRERVDRRPRRHALRSTIPRRGHEANQSPRR